MVAPILRLILSSNSKLPFCIVENKGELICIKLHYWSQMTEETWKLQIISLYLRQISDCRLVMRGLNRINVKVLVYEKIDKEDKSLKCAVSNSKVLRVHMRLLPHQWRLKN